MTDAEKPWYRDPPKLIPVLVGITVLVPAAGAVINRLGPDEPEGRVEYVVDGQRLTLTNGSQGLTLTADA